MESSGLHVGKRSEPTHHSDVESLFALSGKCHFFCDERTTMLVEGNGLS